MTLTEIQEKQKAVNKTLTELTEKRNTLELQAGTIQLEMNEKFQELIDLKRLEIQEKRLL